MIMASGSRAGLSSNEQKKIISQLVDVTGWDEKRSRGALEERQWNLQHVLEMDFIEGMSHFSAVATLQFFWVFRVEKG
jgi:hypothetical protein